MKGTFPIDKFRELRTPLLLLRHEGAARYSFLHPYRSVTIR